MEVIAMSDLETNKAIALRLVEVFNGRQLDRLEDVLHSKLRGRGISADSLAIMPQIGLARKAWPTTKQAEKY